MPYVTAAAGDTDPERDPRPPAQDSGADHDEGCVFCAMWTSDEPDQSTYVLWRGSRVFAVLNAYPYASGHLMVMPGRHVGALEDLTDEERSELWRGVEDAVAAVKAAYRPDGLNLGANLGRAAGAGFPRHLHLHVVPRWSGDTNFMTSVAEARVLPEALPVSWTRLREAWPDPPR
jgi:diadenosine tetraphosphate (Ap4A) HIT family hydrolase